MLLLFVIALLPLPSQAQGIDGRVLLAFHACDVQPCESPTRHEVYLAQSRSGQRFEIVPGWTPYPGSVPEVVRRGEQVYVFTTRQVRRASVHASTWPSPVPLVVHDEAGTVVQGVDPSAIVVDGQLWLYLLEGAPGQDPARCPRDTTTCERRILLAREDPGSDGSSFTLDPQPTLSVTVDPSWPTASDPEVLAAPGGGFVLLLSRGMAVESFVSSRPDGPWQRSGIIVEQGIGGVPSAVAWRRRFLTYVASRVEGVAAIRRAVVASLTSPIPRSRFHTIYPGIWGRVLVSSPSIALNEPGPPSTAAATAGP
ncbi:MAG: hypothetical protein FJ090_19895 [Deltaproteobacteria bacterium]|nr:hypothetical protein [Deltaproteobacteria bacterium]